MIANNRKLLSLYVVNKEHEKAYEWLLQIAYIEKMEIIIISS